MAPQVFLTDGDASIAEVTTFDLVNVVERDLAVGAWRVVFDPSTAVGDLDAIVNAIQLQVEVVDNETGWKFGGPATQMRRTFQGSRFPTKVDIRGVDWMTILAETLEWPDSFRFDRADETITWTFQQSEFVREGLERQRGVDAGNPTTPNREIPRLFIDTSFPAPFGPTRTWARSNRPLLDVYAPWFQGTDWTFRLYHFRSDVTGFVWAWFEPAVRQTSNVIVSPEFHHGEIEIVETAARATHVIGMGASTGVGDERRTAASISPASGSNWLNRHRESLVNVPSAEQSELDQAVADEIAANGPRRSAIVKDLDIDGWGTEVRIGDYVTVSYDMTEATLQVPVTEYRLEGTPAGWKRTATVGGDEPLVPVRLLANQLERFGSLSRQLNAEAR